MISTLIDPYAARDIDQQIDKILRGLGNPEPPLDLRSVRELLKLDRQFYSSNDTGALQEFVSRMKIGAKQIAKRPSLMSDVVRKIGLKGLWLPDQKRIMIDKDVPKLKLRHVEAHEITHSITPHHQLFLFGDNNETLSKSCHEELEAEANFGSGQLLFMRDRFVNEVNSRSRTLEVAAELSKIFGNTITMTLWRMIEEAHEDEPIFGVISDHPHYPADRKNPCRYFIVSSAFRKRFHKVTEISVFATIQEYARRVRQGPLGEGEGRFLGIDGKYHRFHMETFHNSYQALTLGTYICPVSVQVAV